MFYLPSFIGGWPVFPAPFAKVIVFSPLHILASFVKDKVFIGVWIYLWAFYLFLFVSICSIDLYFCLCASTILSGILNSWHLPGGWQPEISSPEETHSTPEMMLSRHTQETERLGPGRWLRCTSLLGQCVHQVPGLLSRSDLGRAQNSCPTESVPLQSAPEPEPEQHRPSSKNLLKFYIKNLTHCHTLGGKLQCWTITQGK